MFEGLSGETSINISKEEYERLIDDSNLLTALQNAGVDNWDGYYEALKIYNGEEE